MKQISALSAPSAETDASIGRRPLRSHAKSWTANATHLCATWLFVADIAALAIAFLLVSAMRHAIFGDLPPLHWGLWTAIASWLLLRVGRGLYTPYGVPPPEKLRRSFHTSVGAASLHLGILIATDELHDFRLVALLIWLLVLPLTFTFRSIVRELLIKAGRYGVPIAVIGEGLAVRRAIREMQAHPDLGYVPVALFNTDEVEPEALSDILGVPHLGHANAALGFQFPYPVNHAVLAMDAGWQEDRNRDLAWKLGRRFRCVQVLSNFVSEGQWLAKTRPIGPYLAIEVRNAQFSPHQRRLKRLLDISISLPALVLCAPLLVVAGVGIKLADRGPVFFSQIREGRNGKPITIYKLRSMVVGAEAKLADHLAEDETARFEYERTMKIRKDPRIIPVIGPLIRKYSVDELPQLWSILKGDMSLVGPRVMPTNEIELYGDASRLLRREMLPGLTGFWQVEHRNDSDFKLREIADSFYVANWSVWLDIWIIMRTFRAVVSGAGAS